MPMSLNDEQPAPIAPDPTLAVSATWDLVILDLGKIELAVEDPADPIVVAITRDMRERDALGAAKYGVRHTALNGRDHLIDAYQEGLDLVVYLRAWIAEHTADFDTKKMWADCTERERQQRMNLRDVKDVYWKTMRHLVHLRSVIENVRAELA